MGALTTDAPSAAPEVAPRSHGHVKRGDVRLHAKRGAETPMATRNPHGLTPSSLHGEEGVGDSTGQRASQKVLQVPELAWSRL
jgi:hypothetical protein